MQFIDLKHRLSETTKSYKLSAVKSVQTIFQVSKRNTPVLSYEVERTSECIAVYHGWKCES